jgi:hypothetical protein
MSAPALDRAAVIADRRAWLSNRRDREHLEREQLERQKALIDRANPGQVTHQSETLARQIRDIRLIEAWLGRELRALPEDGTK